MPTPIEQALITLVPTINNLPNELVDLAISLLAQSRAKAATLKPDEEIGRTFAVCHIACERLKQRLGIDKLNARPPVPPRVYKKLYTYLDSALTATATTPRTPRHRDAASLGSLQNTPSSMRTRAATTAAVGIENGMTGRSTPGSVGLRQRNTPGSGGANAVAASGGRRSTRLPPKTVNALPAFSTSRLSLRNDAQDTTATTARVIELMEEGKEEGKVPRQTSQMAEAICAAFDLPDAATYIISGCRTVLASRGWKQTEAEVIESPVSNRKRTRNSTFAHNDNKDDEQFERGRGRKRRRTDDLSHAEIEPTTDTADGVITMQTLPALLIALSLYVIITLKGVNVSGEQYNEARDVAIDALKNLDGSPLTSKEFETATRKHVAAFLIAAHSEGWLEKQWSLDLKAEAKRREDVGKADTVMENAEEEAIQAEEERAIVEEERELEIETVQLRTPRKNKRPAKTPLRRKEKHAPRPSSILDGSDDAEVGGVGKAGLRSGLGTMFQDAVDWLSYERCEGYKEWESWIRIEVDRIEGEGLSATTVAAAS